MSGFAMEARQNRISSLPENAFRDMPVLQVLDLSSNLLKEVNEHVFSSVFSQLVGFYFSGNPVRCDSTIKWLKSAHDNEMLPVNNDVKYLTCDTPYYRKNATVLTFEDVPEDSSHSNSSEITTNDFSEDQDNSHNNSSQEATVGHSEEYEFSTTSTEDSTAEY